MARLSRTSRTRGRNASTARTTPFLLIAQAGRVLRDSWSSLTPADRTRLAELLKASKGRPMHLTPRQRQELANIVKRADLASAARELATPVASRRTTHRRGPLRRR